MFHSDFRKNTVEPRPRVSVFGEEEEHVYNDLNIMDAHLGGTNSQEVYDTSSSMLSCE